MAAGLVLGKFHPLHVGHIGLIHFAMNRCERLYVLVCAAQSESISGKIRIEWVQEEMKDFPDIIPVLLPYDENELPNTSVSSREVSSIWADKIRQVIPEPVDIVFSSEPYGAYLAQFLYCRHIDYDIPRNAHPVSASRILSHPFSCWEYISRSARPYFVKKVCICGTESTGKTTLTERLAKHYQTVFVPEAGRMLIPHTEECTPELLEKTAIFHAQLITEKQKQANRLLFSDTDFNTTLSYSRFLFGKDLEATTLIEEANRFDLWLYLEPDAPYVQDGTRLNQTLRNALDQSHRQTLISRNVPFTPITGNWEERFEQAVRVVSEEIGCWRR
ncbi:MAG: AAA family ATPase [Bacteroidia bacterium]